MRFPLAKNKPVKRIWTGKNSKWDFVAWITHWIEFALLFFAGSFLSPWLRISYRTNLRISRHAPEVTYSKSRPLCVTPSIAACINSLDGFRFDVNLLPPLTCKPIGQTTSTTRARKPRASARDESSPRPIKINEEIHFSLTLASFFVSVPWSVLISRFGAFCTSLPPELELEAEPMTNRRRFDLRCSHWTGCTDLPH